MEPFISLGLKQGAHIIAASFYRGGEVISPDLTAEQRKAYYEAFSPKKQEPDETDKNIDRMLNRQ